jgi:hypothetical protein
MSQAMKATPDIPGSIAWSEVKRDHRGRLIIATHKHGADGSVGVSVSGRQEQKSELTMIRIRKRSVPARRK